MDNLNAFDVFMEQVRSVGTASMNLAFGDSWEIQECYNGTYDFRLKNKEGRTYGTSYVAVRGNRSYPEKDQSGNLVVDYTFKFAVSWNSQSSSDALAETRELARQNLALTEIASAIEEKFQNASVRVIMSTAAELAEKKATSEEAARKRANELEAYRIVEATSARKFMRVGERSSKSVHDVSTETLEPGTYGAKVDGKDFSLFKSTDPIVPMSLTRLA